MGKKKVVYIHKYGDEEDKKENTCLKTLKWDHLRFLIPFKDIIWIAQYLKTNLIHTYMLVCPCQLQLLSLYLSLYDY